MRGCGFDFAEFYGAIGERFAECHHVRPLHEGQRRTYLRDLAILCANCHRMPHRDGLCTIGCAGSSRNATFTVVAPDSEASVPYQVTIPPLSAERSSLAIPTLSLRSARQPARLLR
jgi:hypothetical protein